MTVSLTSLFVPMDLSYPRRFVPRLRRFVPTFDQFVPNSLARVVQKVDNAMHRINHYPADSVVCFVYTYPPDSDLSGG